MDSNGDKGEDGGLEIQKKTSCADTSLVYVTEWRNTSTAAVKIEFDCYCPMK